MQIVKEAIVKERYCRGIMPYSERRRRWERSRAQNAASAGVSNATGTINEGDEVTRKSSALYASGAIAFYIDAGRPRLGQLIEDCAETNEQRRFQVIADEEDLASLLYVLF